MTATTAAYDVVFLVHVLAAVDTIIVFVVMRTSANALVRGIDQATQRKKFPVRRNWAARVLHVLPVTGLFMSLSGTSAVSLTKPWIIVGLVAYAAAAGHLEARTLPQEQVISEVIAHDGVASPERGRQLLRSIDTMLALVAIALLAMLVQF